MGRYAECHSTRISEGNSGWSRITETSAYTAFQTRFVIPRSG